MDRTGDHRVKQNNPGSERQWSNVFSTIWKIDSKDKCIQKYKQDHTHTFATEQLFEGSGGGKRGKENDKEWKNIEVIVPVW
jgi:hypothetical protein